MTRSLPPGARLAPGSMPETAVTLPWPTGPLWPNSRPHWSVRARHVAKARRDAWALCLEAGLPKGEARLRVTFRPPRKPGLANVDNAIAAMKAAIDGIADALGVDDSRLRIEWPVAFGEPVEGGAVIVDLQPAQERPRDIPASDADLRVRMAEQVEALRGRGFVKVTE